MLRLLRGWNKSVPMLHRCNSTLEDIVNAAKQRRADPQPKSIVRTIADRQKPSETQKNVTRDGYITAPVQKTDYSSNQPNLTNPLQDASADLFSTPNASHLSYHTKTTTLPNGVRVVTKNLNQMACKIGLCLQSGPSSEPSNMFGISQIYDRMVLKGTKNRSEENILHSIEALGGLVSTITEKDHFGFTIETTPEHVDEAFDITWECFSEPNYTDEAINEALEGVLADVERFHASPGDLVVEASHQAAYGDSGLGSSAYLKPDKLTVLSVSELEEYRRQAFVGSNIIVVGLSVDHEYLVEKARKTYGKLPSTAVPPVKLPNQLYIGGDAVHSFPELDSHFVAVSYPCPSWEDNEIYAAVTWQMLLGGGASFSSGGPGKGMLSRLYRRVLNQYYFVDSIFARVSAYKNTGIFTLYGSVKESQYVSHLTGIIIEQLAEMVSNATDEEINRAKAQLASTLFINLEHRNILMEDLGKQLMYFGRYIEPKELLDNLDKVTKKDIVELARKMVRMRPTIVLLGNLEYAPTPAQIRQELTNLANQAAHMKPFTR